MGEGRPRLVVVEGITFSSASDPYLSLRALASYSGLSPRKLRDFLKDPECPLPHDRVGGKILVRRSEFDGWISQYRRLGDLDVERVVREVLREL